MTKDVNELLKQIDEKRDEVVTDSYTISWREVINLYKESEITISPDYQRLYRWDNARQSQFIESLLLNIPTPTLFFYIDTDGKQEVIDGLQRVSTIIRFFSEEIFKRDEIENAISEGSHNDLRNPTVLSDTPIITTLDGWRAKELPEKVTRTIKNARVNIVILEQETKPETKYNVFKRLNRSGVRLSDQEIRNCMARLAGNDFADRLRRLAEIDGIIEALGLNKESQKSQGVEEALLRVMASLTYSDNFNHGVSDFLDEFMFHAAEENIIDISFELKLKRTFDLINLANLSGKAFKFWKDGQPSGSFSTNLLDVVAVGIFKNVDNLTPADVNKRFMHLVNNMNDELRECTGAGSNTRVKLNKRISLGEMVFC
ncbi:Uncharacterized conserved protein [Serratia quinivorans]|uniref:DUF262 domain-containing protein n=1 Tax=Serratia quinivorans TaxID=137545 RepID=UPI0021790017|nr:DUF262 domain-containing protein [Serratia quinivorans]CAI1899336.1 Uncharacterized conserved protein [Serratia quinivorans]CAI1988364.1 Uncharacterized conserved protein [Serratia quinivorans]CAI2146928.1 Uncharacterized conserved protein [Serratia quinivorans]CAI2397986.1 Uncharacterized conserved protein [Serratia quinivorans]